MITHVPKLLPNRWVSTDVYDSGEYRGTVVMPKWEFRKIEKKERQR